MNTDSKEYFPDLILDKNRFEGVEELKIIMMLHLDDGFQDYKIKKIWAFCVLIMSNF